MQITSRLEATPPSGSRLFPDSMNEIKLGFARAMQGHIGIDCGELAHQQENDNMDLYGDAVHEQDCAAICEWEHGSSRQLGSCQTMILTRIAFRNKSAKSYLYQEI